MKQAWELALMWRVHRCSVDAVVEDKASNAIEEPDEWGGSEVCGGG